MTKVTMDDYKAASSAAGCFSYIIEGVLTNNPAIKGHPDLKAKADNVQRLLMEIQEKTSQVHAEGTKEECIPSENIKS